MPYYAAGPRQAGEVASANHALSHVLPQSRRVSWLNNPQHQQDSHVDRLQTMSNSANDPSGGSDPSDVPPEGASGGPLPPYLATPNSLPDTSLSAAPSNPRPDWSPTRPAPAIPSPETPTQAIQTALVVPAHDAPRMAPANPPHGAAASTVTGPMLHPIIFNSIASMILDGRSFGMFCRAQLDNYVAQSRNTDVSHPATKQAMTLLRVCTRTQPDLFFLLLHQLTYCLDIPHTLPLLIQQAPALKAQLRLVQTVMRNGLERQVAPDLVFEAWASRFPFTQPLETLCAEVVQITAEIAAIAKFLESFDVHHTNLRNQCLVRQFPPLAEDMLSLWPVNCPLLRYVIFTDVLYCVWPDLLGKPYVLQKCHETFAQNMANATRGLDFTGRPYTEPPRQHYQRIWSQVRNQITHIERTRMAQQYPEQRLVNYPAPAPNLRPVLQQQTTVAGSPQTHLIGTAQPQGPRRPSDSHQLATRQPTGHLMTDRHGQRQELHPAESNQPVWPVASHGPIFPQRDQPGPQAAPPNPDTYAAHVPRPPTTVYNRSGSEEDGATTNVYQYVSGFALEPKRIAAGALKQIFRFSISEETKLPVQKNSAEPLRTDDRLIDSRTTTYRLKCIRVAEASGPIPTPSDWVTSDTTWDDRLIFRVNARSAEPMMKLHFGKDQAVDITDSVRIGDNTVQVNSLFDKTPGGFLIAVETIRIMAYQSIVDLVQSHEQPSVEALQSIKLALNVTDSEVSCTSEDITISLIDPIKGITAWKTPVRSRACKHREAFDLESFLQTRLQQDGVSKVDIWRCPICKADARPEMLVVDGWLANVRFELEKRRELQTKKAVVVRKDGSWTAVDAQQLTRGQSGGRRATEVIELD